MFCCLRWFDSFQPLEVVWCFFFINSEFCTPKSYLGPTTLKRGANPFEPLKTTFLQRSPLDKSLSNGTQSHQTISNNFILAHPSGRYATGFIFIQPAPLRGLSGANAPPLRSAGPATFAYAWISVPNFFSKKYKKKVLPICAECN